ncbi:MAG: TrbC/VirB2 family protein [Alphaproteobacteria bacterium]|nr:TrbC/VirB2 family protein [Alphaproteobacteria bacterium]
MNKMLKYAMMSLAVAVTFTAVGAFAAGDGNVFNTVLDRMLVTFRNSRSVIFVVGGFGLIGLGFAAIFGKVNWKWLAALACGLAIVAVAGQVVDYVTRQDVGQNKVDVVGSSFGDTLSDNESGYSTHYSPDQIDLHVN